MLVREIDALAREFSERQMKMDAVKEELKELEGAQKETIEKLADALVEEGKEKWEIPGYKPLKLSRKTYWNVNDINVLFSVLKPEMCSAGHLAQAVRSWANTEYKAGKDLTSMGISPYDKLGISGGGVI